MEIIRSKRHPVKFYGVLIVLSVIVIGLTFILIQEGALQEDKQGKLLIPLGLSLLLVYSIIRYRKNTPAITITKQKISFDKTSYSLSDIEKIDFTGKQNFKYILGYPMEGAKIIFKDETVKYIFDDMYNNAADLKMALESGISDKKMGPIQKSNYSIAEEHFRYYRGNIFLSLKGIFFIFCIACFTLISVGGAVTNASMAGIAISIIIFLLPFLIFKEQFHYFGFNTRLMIIKNYISVWKVNVYKFPR